MSFMYERVCECDMYKSALSDDKDKEKHSISTVHLPFNIFFSFIVYTIMCCITFSTLFCTPVNMEGDWHIFSGHCQVTWALIYLRWRLYILVLAWRRTLKLHVHRELQCIDFFSAFYRFGSLIQHVVSCFLFRTFTDLVNEQIRKQYSHSSTYILYSYVSYRFQIKRLSFMGN